MTTNHKIAVFGGTGKAGIYLIKTLLSQGYAIGMLLRNPAKAADYNHPQIEIITGTVSDPDAVDTLLKGCTAVISTLGMGNPPSNPDIFTRSTQHILQAMERYQLRRYILITGLNVDTPTDRKGSEATAGTAWMKAHFPVSTENKQQEYELLSRSALDWTMVRLPRIEQSDELQDICIDLEDCPGSSISATSLARFLIGQIEVDTYYRKAPFVADR